MKKTFISLCDRTGNMVKPWADAGFFCICVDTQHSIRNDKQVGNIVYTWGDVRSWSPVKWRTDFHDNHEIVFVSAFPPCTHLAGSGARDFKKKGIPKMYDGLMLFNSCLQIAGWSAAPYMVENPVGVIPTHERKPDYYFHPWNYGDGYQKKTALWTGNGFIMPEFQYTEKPEWVEQSIWRMPPSEDRADKRSETPMGFAKAVFESNSKI